MTITKELATDIALTHRDIEEAKELLKKVEETIENRNEPVDVRDRFGRPITGLELGVPISSSGKRIFNVDWLIARPIIKAQIAKYEAHLDALNAQAFSELKGEK